MPLVRHKSYGSTSSSEAIAAEKLKCVFEKLPCEGSVFIASNVTLPGGNKIKDLDIVVVGYLDDCFIDGFKYPLTFSGSRKDKKGLQVRSFLAAIELKDFSINQIQINETGLLTGLYSSGENKNITKQSFEQKDALRNVLNFYRNITPYTYHLIWLERIDNQDFVDQFGLHNEWNILAGDIDAYDVLRAIAYNGNRAIYQDDWYLINSFSKTDTIKEVEDVFDLFLSSKTSMGNLTRHKVESISQSEIQDATNIVSGKITVLQGRAGTGKTIRLLQFAYQQVLKGKKCVLLTYNHALVSDIRRLIALADFPISVNEGLSIETMYHFFSTIMGMCGIDNDYIENDFDKVYSDRLKRLKDTLLSTNIELSWDFALVDEAQDWSLLERDILFALFRPEQIVIADGIDQFVRSLPCGAWNIGELNTYSFTKSVRQKSNLVSFVNTFAQAADIPNWNIEPNTNIKGGRVIITSGVSKALLEEVKKDCLDKGNAMYDILVLATSAMSKPLYMSSLLRAWEKIDFRLFDGTQKESREFYSIDVNDARIFNYNSCRGIEGWTVVCLDLDMLIDEKLNTIKIPPIQIGETEYDRQVRVWRQVCLWVLMPLTRAIDTLVITLRDPNSKVGHLLHDLTEKHDFIEWRI